MQGVTSSRSSEQAYSVSTKEHVAAVAADKKSAYALSVVSLSPHACHTMKSLPKIGYYASDLMFTNMRVWAFA